MAIYKKINPIERAGSEPLNELKLNVRYRKDNPRGLSIDVKPVSRTTINNVVIESCTFCSDRRENGICVFKKPLNRKSAKAEDELAAKLSEKADEIASLWNESKFDDVRSIINAM